MMHRSSPVQLTNSYLICRDGSPALALWMDEILNHLQTIGHHNTGSRVAEQWCEMHFATIHSTIEWLISGVMLIIDRDDSPLNSGTPLVNKLELGDTPCQSTGG